MKLSKKPIVFFFAAIIFTAFCSIDEKKIATKEANAQTQTAPITDTAVFYTRLCEALRKRDPELLSPLLAGDLRCDFADGDNECSRVAGCPKSVILERYFKDAKAKGWAKFDLLQRVRGFGEKSEYRPSGTRTFLIAPHFQDTNIQSSIEYAYVFADQVQVRDQPSKSGKVLKKISRCFVAVDTETLCYDNADDDWLPVHLSPDETAYIFIDFTNWSDHHGYVQVMPDAKGVLHIVNMTWGRHPLGTWYLPGCC